MISINLRSMNAKLRWRAHVDTSMVVSVLCATVVLRQSAFSATSAIPWHGLNLHASCSTKWLIYALRTPLRFRRNFVSMKHSLFWFNSTKIYFYRAELDICNSRAASIIFKRLDEVAKRSMTVDLTCDLFNSRFYMETHSGRSIRQNSSSLMSVEWIPPFWKT